MKTLFIIIMASLSLNAFASTGKCEIYYSSIEDYKLRWMDGSEEKIEDMTLEECVGHAGTMLGVKQQWKTLIRRDIRTITIARYKFSSESVNSKGTLALPGQEF